MDKDIFYSIASVNNLFLAFKEFKKGKKKKPDVQLFKFNLKDNILKLNELLITQKWIPDDYVSFYVKDPKLRQIHKTSVRDRVLNQAVSRILYEIFDKNFIFDSYSSRISKGTHKAVFRLDEFIRKESSNYRFNVFALKCDVQKFFDNISHDILFNLIKRRILKNIRIRKAQLDKGLITNKSFEQTINSYFGVLKHCKGFKIKKEILKIIKNID